MLQPAHERDADILFEEEAHKYTVRGRHDFKSVTTVVGQLFSAFDADKVIQKMMRGAKWALSPYFGMTADAIKAKWKLAGDDAAAEGTRMHADIEHFYKGEPYENESVEFKQFLDFHRNLDPDFRPYRSEWRVFNEDVGIVGTIDMLFQRGDGTVAIYDWKRCKKIEKSSPWGRALHPAVCRLPDTNYWHYALQLNLYQFLLETKYDLKVSSRVLVCMHPDRATYELVPVEDLQAEIKLILANPNAKPAGAKCLMQVEEAAFEVEELA